MRSDAAPSVLASSDASLEASTLSERSMCCVRARSRACTVRLLALAPAPCLDEFGYTADIFLRPRTTADPPLTPLTLPPMLPKRRLLLLLLLLLLLEDEDEDEDEEEEEEELLVLVVVLVVLVVLLLLLLLVVVLLLLSPRPHAQA